MLQPREYIAFASFRNPHVNSISEKMSRLICQPYLPCQEVLRAASDQGVSITRVLTTHHHSDHAGGNTAIKSEIPGLDVVGGEKDRVQGCTTVVRDGDTLTVGSISLLCLHTPG